jgi:hypothetical protein
MNGGVDVLMITYNRPQYTRLSLQRLLDTAPEDARIWVWHNGTDEETLDVVRSHVGHPRFHQFHQSRENVKLTEPTNWLWRESSGGLLGKVDDDCLVPHGWIEVFRNAHEANPELGVIGCWHFFPGDAAEADLKYRIVDLKGHSLLRNCWIGGSGYLLKRSAQAQQGLLAKGKGWSHYVIRLSARGWLNGWYYPFLYQDHMDDPRSPHTQFKTDEDVRQKVGLTSRGLGVTTIEEALRVQEEGLREILTSSLNPHDYVGLRAKVKRCREWIQKRF